MLSLREATYTINNQSTGPHLQNLASNVDNTYPFSKLDHSVPSPTWGSIFSSSKAGAELLGFPHTKTYLFENWTIKMQWQISVSSHLMFPLKLSITRSRFHFLGVPKTSFSEIPASLLCYGKRNSTYTLPSDWWGEPIPISPRIPFFLQIVYFPDLSLCFLLSKNCHCMTLSIASTQTLIC